MRVRLVILIAFSLPLFLGITNVRVLAVTPAFYEWGFRRHQVGLVTGLDQEQLRRVADTFIAYFKAPPGRLDIRVRLNGQDVPLFNEREIAHMVDVQALMQTLAWVQLVSGLVILAGLVGLGALERRPLGPTAGVGLVVGSGLTLVVLALLGLATVIDFESFWTSFHLVAFTNDLWMLDPSRDNLIRLFPPPFWVDATLLLAAATALEALLVGVVGLLAYSGVWGPRAGISASTTQRSGVA